MSEAQTLVLTQAYEPLKVVSWKRAVELLTLGKVEVLETHDQEVRSAFIVMKIPSVVRLIRAFRRPVKNLKFSRINVYARDDYRCQYCSKPCNMSELTYDHVVPRSQNGKTTWTNIVSCCVKCNSRKAGRTPEQSGMKLLKKPIQPKKIPAVYLQVSKRDVPDAWRDYLYWTGALETED